MSGSGGAASLGYSHPDLTEAVQAAAGNMAGASLLMYPNESAVQLAEALVARTPGIADPRVWFGHSGSDANDCVVRTLLHAAITRGESRRSRFISFVGSYHGNLSASMGVSGHTAMTHSLPRAGLVLLPYPDQYRQRFSPDEVLKLLDYYFATTCTPDQVAGVFMEPILSDGGVVVPPPGFLKAMQDRCRPHGIPIVLDEVKVGVGRSGRFHCYEHEGLTPDIVVLGKGIGGGLPLSAVIGPSELMDCGSAFAIQTTSGNPEATAAGLAVLRVIERDDLVRNAHVVGQVIVDGLRELARRHPTIGDIRGRGLAVGIDLVADRTTREPVHVKVTAKLVYAAFKRGLAMLYVGLEGNVVEWTSPLTLTAEDAANAIEIFGAAMSDIECGSVADELVAPYMPW